MKLRYLVLIVAIFLQFVTFACAQEQKVDIKLDVISPEINDAHVVGEFFYYTINITNRGTGIINDTFTISVFNPSGNLLDSRNYTVLIEPNGSHNITAKGGKENETAIFPFDTAGDYKIEINSTKPIDFYQWVSDHTRYIRQPKNFKYFFDVMPRWQYDLSISSELANQKIITLTTELNTATQSMLSATEKMVIIAICTSIIAFWTSIIAYITYKNSKK